MTKRPFLQSPSGALVGALAGAAIGVLAARSGVGPPALGLGTGGTIALVVLVPLLFCIVIAAHELGHIGGGLIVGFRPLLFIVGPLRVERKTAGGLRYGLNRSFALAGGLAASAPVGMHDLRRRTIVMVAGGPIASLMFGTQCLVLYEATSPIAGLAAGSLLLLGLVSLAIGVITLLPMRTGGFYSDGARMLRLMRAGEDTEREVALLMITSMSLGGTRPADWDAALVDQLPAGGRSSLLTAAATFHALYDAEPARARALLARATGQSLLTAPHERMLADAALLLADGDAAGAADVAREAQMLIEQSPDRGGSALDHDLAGQIIERARQDVSA